MTPEAQLVLNRNLAIKENVDPFGTKWGIAPIKGFSLYQIGKVNTDEDKVELPKAYPKFEGVSDMSGRFTSPSRAQTAIQAYLHQVWDKNDREAREAAGKARARKQREEENKAKDATSQG